MNYKDVNHISKTLEHVHSINDEKYSEVEYLKVIKTIQSTSNYKNVIIEMVENAVYAKEVFYILKALYAEYRRLSSSNNQLIDHLSLIKSILDALLREGDNIGNKKRYFKYSSSQSLLKILFMLIVIYIKHNKDDMMLLNTFLNVHLNSHISTYYIREVLRHEGINEAFIDNIPLVKKKQNKKDLFSYRIRNYLPEEYDHYQILPIQLRMSSISKLVGICQNGHEAKFLSKENSCQTSISDKPIDQSIGIYYFEIKVLSQKSISAIGIVDKDFNLQSRLPGMEANSIGYHSHDGNAYVFTRTINKYGPKYSLNDYVGCCINFIDKMIFFTVNGVRLTNIFINLNSVDFFPAVAMTQQNQQLLINYGQWPFCYNISLYKSDMTKRYYERIINTVISIKVDYASLIKDYLVYNGYADTYNDFIRESNYDQEHQNNENGMIIENDDNDYKIDARKEILSYIKIKDFDSLRRVIIANFRVYTEAFYVIDFYEKIISSLKELSSDIGSTSVFIAFLRKEIVQVKECEVLKKIMLRYDEFIKECSHVIIYSKDKAIVVMNEIIEKYLDCEYVFSLINRSLLKDNYDGINDNELHCILKQLLLIFKEGVKYNQIKIRYLLANDDCFEQMNKMLIQKKIMTSDILLEKTFNEYFAHLSI